MKYLLLGGSGFIGKRLASALATEHDITITGLDPNFSLENTNYKQLDFTKCTDFKDLIKNFDAIVHMISTIIPSDDLSRVNQEVSDNVFPTTRLLENAAELGKTIIFISSGGSVYGNSDHPNSETDPTNPICNYGITKLLIEKYLSLYHHFYNLNYRIVRLSNPYSEEIYHNKKQGVIPVIIDNIINNKPITIWGDDKVRDYIHIDDAIAGIIAALNYDGNERIFNIGSGVGHSIKDVLAIAEEKLDKKSLVEHASPRKCDVNYNVLNINLIKNQTGWSPKINLSEGIDKIIKNKLNTEVSNG